MLSFGLAALVRHPVAQLENDVAGKASVTVNDSRQDVETGTYV